MRLLKKLVITNLKLHKNLVISGLLSLILYAGYISYVLLIKSNDAGNNLQLSSFLIQSGMLFFMLLGFQSAKKNIKSGSLFDVLGKDIRRIHVFNVLFLLLISLLFVLLILISILLYYRIGSSFTPFSAETFLFLIHYWLLPFWVLGIIGYVFGVNSNSKIIYVLLIIIWILVSPTNLNYFVNLIDNTRIWRGIEWLENLNLGVYDLSDLYHSFYGFEYNWIKKFMLLFSMVIICFISFFSTNRRKLQILNIVAVIIVLLLFSLYPNRFIKKDIENIDHLIKDYNYYNDSTSLSIDKKLFDYDIKKVDLKIQNFKNFDVEAVMNITYRNQKELAFTLYQGFNVYEINLNNGEKVSFNQEGDYIIVYLPEHIQNKKQIDLNIKYSGMGSTYRPATSKYIYLPADFGWIPSNQTSLTHFMFNDDILTTSIKAASKIKYTLNYCGANDLDYINLSEGNDGIFEGEAEGVTLILGNITNQTINGHKIFYPTSWFLYNREIEKYLNEFNIILKKYNHLFNAKYELPKEVILLPNMDMNNNYSYINSFSDKDHIILQINPVDLTKTVEINDLIPFQIERAFGNRIDDSKYSAWFIYNSMLGNYIGHVGLTNSNSLKQFLLQFAEFTVEPKYKAIYEQLIKIDENTLSDDFFVKWKELLLDKNSNDWSQLEELINKYS